MPWGFIIRGVLARKSTQSYWLALSLYPRDVSIKFWQVFVKSSSSVLWQGWLESFVPIVENVDMVGIEFENRPSSRVSDPFCMLSNPTSCWDTLSTPGFWTNCQYRKKPHLTYFICCVCVHKSACVSAHTHLYLPRGSRRGQRTVFRSWFFHSILGTKLRLSRLSSRHFYPLSQLTGPIPHFWKVTKSTLC